MIFLAVAAPAAAALEAHDTSTPGPPLHQPCTIKGTRGPDTLFGTPHHDVICGLRGSDILIGGGGTDTLRGGRGDDTLNARDGLDGGHDTLIGARGDDVCFADSIDHVDRSCERP